MEQSKVQSSHDQDSLLGIWDRNGKSVIVFPQKQWGTAKPKQHSRSLGGERENPNVIPIGWDGKGKCQMLFLKF